MHKKWQEISKITLNIYLKPRSQAVALFIGTK